MANKDDSKGGLGVAASDRTSLIDSSLKLQRSLAIFQDINDKAHFIALNAAIEGARMKSRLSTFSIVAGQIAAQASKNIELSEKLELAIDRNRRLAFDATAIRNLELADDLIDKLDRNLFERNCDVQAWASFDIIKGAVNRANGHAGAETDAASDPTNVEFGKASHLLNKLVTIYVVYLNSFLLDKKGNVISCAKRGEHLGKNWSDRDWFRRASQGEMNVTALHDSDILQAPSLFYVAPVTDDSGQAIGVLCNCFDWAYALEMIKSADYDSNVSGSVIDDRGWVIASLKSHLILTDRMDWSLAGEAAVDKKCGFSVERARNGDAIVVGYSHTKGYNAYKGKGWSSIVTSRLGTIPLDSKIVATSSRGDSGQKVETTGAETDGRIESEKIGLQLRESMKDIDRLVYEVNANNRAVKLLAVNASIQAGLAGADGEGFSIIANEVANLAKKSLQFVDEVNLTTSSLRSAVDSSISLRLVDAANDAMSKVDRNLFERYCDIQAWSTFDKIVGLLEGNVEREVCLKLLESVHKIYEVYHDIYVLDMSGKVVAAAINRSVHGQTFTNKDWFKAAASGSIYYSDIYVSDTLKCPVITFSAPIMDAQNQIKGVICSRFNCGFLDQIIRATIADSKSTTFLLNQKGQVVGSRDGAGVLEKNFAELSLFKSLDQPRSGLLHEAEEGTERELAVGFSFSKGYNSYKGQKWSVVTLRPVEAHEARTGEEDPKLNFQKLLRSKFKKAA